MRNLLLLLVAIPALATPTFSQGQLILEFRLEQIFSERIIEAISGGGTFSAPDPFTAPLKNDPLGALSALGAPVPSSPLFSFLFLQTFFDSMTNTTLIASPDAVFVGELDDIFNTSCFMER